jgi:hypothetical protein
MKGTPHCKIFFDQEKACWAYEIWYPGYPVHDHGAVYATVEHVLLWLDTQRERVWEESGEGLERVLLSREFKPGSVGARMSAWRPAR